jgi:hypothetical protein
MYRGRRGIRTLVPASEGHGCRCHPVTASAPLCCSGGTAISLDLYFRRQVFPAVNRLERPAPNRQVRRRYRSPKRLRGRRGASFPTRPRLVRLPCPHGLHQTWARSAARAVARLPMPTSRRDQRRLNRQRQRGGHGNARPMPVAVQQRLLARVRDQDESLGILIGAFATNPVLRRSCVWPSIRDRNSPLQRLPPISRTEAPRRPSGLEGRASLLPAPVGARERLTSHS